MLWRGSDAFEVTDHMEGGMIRAVCLGSVAGTTFGDVLTDSGHAVQVLMPPPGSVVDGLGRILESGEEEPAERAGLPLFAEPPALSAITGVSGTVDTGITAIDFLAPIPRGGSACVAGERGTGKSELVWSLLHLAGADRAVVATSQQGRVAGLEAFLGDGLGGIAASGNTFVLARPGDAPALRARVPLSALAVAEHRRSGMGLDTLLLVDGTFGSAAASLLREGRFFERCASAEGQLTLVFTAEAEAGQEATDAAGALSGSFDAVIATTAQLSSRAIFPAVDVVESTSKALDPSLVGQRHCDAAMGTKELLMRARELEEAVAMLGEDVLSPADALVVRRAALARAALDQPSVAFERVTGRRGEHRVVQRAVELFEELLAGTLDSATGPELAARMRGA